MAVFTSVLAVRSVKGMSVSVKVEGRAASPSMSVGESALSSTSLKPLSMSVEDLEVGAASSMSVKAFSVSVKDARMAVLSAVSVEPVGGMAALFPVAVGSGQGLSVALGLREESAVPVW